MVVPGAPRIRRTAQNTQFTYNLSRRVHDVKTYPVLSPQGASILICGHENGVIILWRGGRRFKTADEPPAATASSGKRNGSSDNEVMIIDSDDDDAATAKPKNSTEIAPAEFEEAVHDDAYPEIIQSLDLVFGAAVLHVAIVPMTPTTSEDVTWGGTDLLKSKMVFAVSCATNDIYLVTLPLTPPSPQSKSRPELRRDLLAGRPGSGAWGESVVHLGGQMKPSRGIALTLTKSGSTTTTFDQRRDSSISAGPPRAIVASHTLEAAGTLRLWEVPLELKAGMSSALVEPFQTEYLPSPLSSISFNTTHTSQLLTVTTSHAVRIYDFLTSSIPLDDLSTGPFPSQGSWLLSLYPPFVRNQPIRKPIVDAAWIAHGRAILVLLADGMWGIWDVDGASPVGGTVLGKSKSGITGAAMTTFSVSGFVEGTSPLRAGAPEEKPRASGEFVPMTPHTRKDAALSLSSSVPLIGRLAAIRGGIIVTGHPITGVDGNDESVVLWIGSSDHVCVIPGVARFWDSQVRKSAGGGVNLFTGSQPTRMVRLQDLSIGLLGERCSSIAAITDVSRTKGALKNEGGLGVDIVLCGESRLVLVRETEEGPGAKVGGVVMGRRRFISDRRISGGATKALIVQSRLDQTGPIPFNLNTGKIGSVRTHNLFDRDTPTRDEITQPIVLPSRPRLGLEFADTIGAAADFEDDVETRDVEVEMLDILELDRALDNMENMRDGTKNHSPFREG